MEINNNFNTYIELNDSGDSVICCDNIGSITLYGGSSKLGVKFNYDKEISLYQYSSKDMLIGDYYRIKNIIESLSLNYIKKDETIENKEEE